MAGFLRIIRGVNVLLSQRQEHRRTRWKAPGDVFEPRRYSVEEMRQDAPARAFVQAHHYAGSYVAAVKRYGLFDARQLVGAAVFSAGTNPRTITNVFGDQCLPWQDALELGRFVLRDAVPYNAESWFLARCLDLLARDGVRGVVSFSDPYPRRRADGSLAFAGHWGQIYQASNAIYTGRGTPRRLRILPDGRIFSDRAAQKIRQGERGWAAAVRMLVAAGAPQLAGEPASWLNAQALPITRSVAHPGNHRYVFALGKHAPRILAPEHARPKAADVPSRPL